MIITFKYLFKVYWKTFQIILHIFQKGKKAVSQQTGMFTTVFRGKARKN